MDELNVNPNSSSYKNLAHFHRAMHTQLPKICVSHIIDNFIDINSSIPATNFIQSNQPDLIGCTALHLAFDKNNLEVFDLLLERNADFTIKNHKNMTVVHRVIEENFKKREMSKLASLSNEIICKKSTVDEINSLVIMRRTIEEQKFNKHDNWRLRKQLEDQFINSILSAHVKYNTSSNPCSDNGITHFHAACMSNNYQAVEFFLKNGVNVNQAVNFNSPIYAGFTALHFTNNSKMSVLLLKYGADVKLKNAAGLTALDVILDHNMKITEWINSKYYTLPYDNCIEDYEKQEAMLKIIITVLIDSADNESLSRLHVACTLSDQSIAQSLLKNDTSNINECVSVDSLLWSGYSALHFAAFFNMKIFKLLLENGANIEIKNASGITPFDICVSRATIPDIHFILSSNDSWKNIVLSDGKTLLVDLISTMNNEIKFKEFLEQIDVNSFIPIDSPLWPGYTILHLAVLLSGTTKELTLLEKTHLSYKFQNKIRLQNIEVCFAKNVNVNVLDTQGCSPIHLAFRQRNMEIVTLLLNYLELKYHQMINSSTDNDNLSLLHISCAADNFNVAKFFIINGVDVNSQILSTFKWQYDYHNCIRSDVFNIVGSTPLHIAVTYGSINIIQTLLTFDADITIKDVDELSPLHRNFALNNIWNSAKELFRKHYNTNNSHHCNISGHISYYENYKNIAYELMRVLGDLKESVVNDFQLSHLHIACFHNSNGAIERLLELGSVINLAIVCPENLQVNHPLFFLYNRIGEIPLNFARFQRSEKLLIQRGADILAKPANGMCWLFEKLKCDSQSYARIIGEILKYNDEVKKQLFEESNWTLLHANCRILKSHLGKEALKSNVNTQISINSPIYPGCTALHLLVIKTNVHCHIKPQVFERTFQGLLTNKNADVTLEDANGNTPIHQSIPPSKWLKMHEGKYTARLLGHIKNFQVNPVNSQGISIFHIACSCHNIRVMEEYLKNGVDVNRPVDLFVVAYAGYTPLHLVFLKDIREDERIIQLQVVELLLRYGADVRALDADGNTPLHAAVLCRLASASALEKLVDTGADLNATNLNGRTPLQELLFFYYPDREKIEFFIGHGCHMNSFNPITQVGYLSELIDRSQEHPAFQAAMTCPSIHQIDDFGRTAIHNIVSAPYYKNGPEGTLNAAIRYFIKCGCDIDKQDELGRTALHLAAKFRNTNAVNCLLTYGADININDVHGKTTLMYTLEPEVVCLHSDLKCHTRVTECFAKHIFYLMHYNLYVSKSNRLTNVIAEIDPNKCESMDWTTSLKIGSTSIRLNRFLTETGAVTNYRKFSEADRCAVDEFFKTAHEKFNQYYVNSLCMLQYRKALKRNKDLVERARHALNILLGFKFPELCYDLVEQFLPNADLQHLIESAN